MKPKLGSGDRFAHLEHQLAGRGAHDPGALAAAIGRQKYGDKKMNQLAEHGREQHLSEGGLVADPNNLAKMAVLQKIMDMFTDHQLSGLKKKGQPDMVAVSVKKDDMPLADTKDADGDNDGDEDPELLKALLAEHDDEGKGSDPTC